MSELISQQLVITKKDHDCIGCLSNFTNDSEMIRQTIRDAGEIYSVYICEHCQEILHDAYPEFQEGFEEGDLAEWERENRREVPGE